VELQIKNLPHTGVKVLKQEDHPGRWWPFYSFAPIVTTRGDPTLFIGQATAWDAVVASLSRCGRAAANEVANPPITLMKSRRRICLHQIAKLARFTARVGGICEIIGPAG
jgi:hypothetical protein